MISEMDDDIATLVADDTAGPANAVDGKDPATEVADVPEDERRLVARIIQTIKQDAAHHAAAFRAMRDDMFMATHGRPADYPPAQYKANIVGRHVRMKTAALYAKNPKASARRAERLDFAVWDENPATLQLAFQTVQAATVLASQPVVPDPVTGVTPAPQLPPGFEEAQALIADFQQGTARRLEIDKTGKTLEILFGHAQREQTPLDFKMAMKQLVRRTCTTAVGYIELGFQREYGTRPGMTEQLADAKARLDHLRVLAEDVADGEIDKDDAEMAELKASIEALMAEPEILIREGLIFDYPRSTKVIPDRLCKSLVGFIGARHLTIEYDYTVEQVREIFSVDVSKSYNGYGLDGKSDERSGGNAPVQADLFSDDDKDYRPLAERCSGLVRVWKHYDKVSGLVYYVADGYPQFLRPPAPPDVFVETFWPVFALTFNEVENETELFPPSDVRLISDMQREYNRSRQGMREHRRAARPRWAYSNGAFDDEDIEALKRQQPFEAIGLNTDPQSKLADVLQVVPVPGVDPNLYETGQLFTDMQLVAGTQEAQLGGLAKATATESAIAANASASADGSSIDDLDAFLTQVARASGQILLREMSEEQVKAIAGPGAVWPQMSLADIASEIYLEVEAGSTGKPNRAVELQNWERILPYLIQMPGIGPDWLARETLRRLDDRMDLTGALVAGLPSILMQNRAAQTAPADPSADPAAQGDKGGDKAPAPEGQVGSGPAFGSNQM